MSGTVTNTKGAKIDYNNAFAMVPTQGELFLGVTDIIKATAQMDDGARDRRGHRDVIHVNETSTNSSSGESPPTGNAYHNGGFVKFQKE